MSNALKQYNSIYGITMLHSVKPLADSEDLSLACMCLAVPLASSILAVESIIVPEAI